MKRNMIIGIDLGGTNLKLALMDRSFRIKARQVFSTAGFSEKEDLVTGIAVSVNRIIDDNGLRKAHIMGVGLGLPGPVNSKSGLVHFFPNIPGWKNVRLKAVLQRKIRLPVFIDNDANLMALAEHTIGAARGMQNALCITLGTGVGGGLVCEGSIYRGSTYAAGEIGHVPVNEKGPKCNCGGIACLEAYIGNKRIVKAAKAAFRKDISLEELSARAQKGDVKAIRVWQMVGRYLGIALSGAVNLLNLDVIVIGGGVANAGSSLFDEVRAVVRKRAMSVQARHVKIAKARLGNDAGLLGAAILVQSHIGRRREKNQAGFFR
ncbi:MAG: ROK family protein [Candidatus Omnitrophota bacterium]|jgi:glucokinase|nr:MAG: ROK family protein [Candidatus Omnitrophota bacterium]